MSQCLKLPVLALLENFLNVAGMRGLQSHMQVLLFDIHAMPAKMSRTTNTAVTVMIKLLLLRVVLGPLGSAEVSRIGPSRSMIETSTVQAGTEVEGASVENTAAVPAVVVSSSAPSLSVVTGTGTEDATVLLTSFFSVASSTDCC